MQSTLPFRPVDATIWGQLNPADKWSPQGVIGDFNGNGKADSAAFNMTLGGAAVTFSQASTFSPLIPCGLGAFQHQQTIGAGLLFPV